MNVRNKQAQVGSVRARSALVAASVLLAMQLATAAHAGPNEQAKRIYERIAGEPPTQAELSTMVTAITTACGSGGCTAGSQGLVTAAQTATAAPGFYNVVLKNMVMPWTNRDQTVFAPLNDYAATVIGMVRDDGRLPYRAVGRHSLYGDRTGRALRRAGGLQREQQPLRLGRVQWA